MVLTSMPVGDYDRRVTILTKERGKISAFAKGARKPTGALLACSQPFVFGEFILFEGRDSYNIVSAEISNYFPELRDEIDAIYYGMYFCEFCGYMTKENLDATEQLKVLYVTMRALTKPALNKKLVRAIFELRFMAANGEMPQVFSCVHCGNEELLQRGNAWFSAEAGGLCCEECKAESLDGIYVGTSTIFTMQYIVSAPLEKLYTFTVSEQVLSELLEVMKEFLKKQVGHTMKSEAMLDALDF